MDPVPLDRLLRAATRREHREVEDRLGLPGSVRDEAGLVDLLAGLLAVWAPCERALAAVPGWSRLGLPPRLGEAADLLRADLAALGAPPRSGGQAVPVPGLGAAVGVRYVLLGSALGGRVVATDLERRLGTPVRRATRFLRRAGGDPVGDLVRFRRAVHRGWTEDERAAAVDGARATFALVGRSVPVGAGGSPG